jgi:DNA-binding LacI/PurR family transcriptional regulator
VGGTPRIRVMTAASGAPTMADVARRAGVSHQTVSRVLNDAPAVRAETREAVLKAIADLGYRRNQAARALVTRRSGLIGVIVDELRLYGPASTVSSVAQAAREAGYAITLDLLWDVSGSSVAAALEHQLSQAVEAVVLVAAHGQMPDEAVLRGLSVPVIALDGFLGDATPTAGVDQRAGGVMATRHLLDLGHRRIAHIAGPEDWSQSEGRRAGFLEALAAAGREPGPVVTGDWSPRAGYEATGRILSEMPSVTAIFVANDQMAMGVLRALAEAGRGVPDDVSVVGFDDIPEAAYAQPPLTTIRQDFAALGREAVRLIVGALGGEEPPSTLVPPRLVARQSTSRPPRARRR